MFEVSIIYAWICYSETMSHRFNHAFQDVYKYPRRMLAMIAQGVAVAVTYKKRWDDSYGARGWKPDVSIDDPEIIASTRETGDRINTSVFVHDVLDHVLSGFGVSGHRSEAMAMMQLSKRTGSDPRPDYEQMVVEDILHGIVNGERLVTFLPAELRALLPANHAMSDRDASQLLKRHVTKSELSEMLIQRLFALGHSGQSHAVATWRRLGLDRARQTAFGMTLQRLLERIDRCAEETDVEQAHASIIINNDVMQFIPNTEGQSAALETYQLTVSC